MADLTCERNAHPVDKNKEDSDIMELRDLLIKLGFNVEISLKDLEKICYENLPPESRFDLLQDVMFRLHPEKEFWATKNDSEMNSKILQVSSWFGLTSSEDIVVGRGTKAEQKRFWKLVLRTTIELENTEVVTPIDIELINHLNFIVLNSSILDEVIVDSKGVDMSGDNIGMNVVVNLMEKIEGETIELEKQMEDERKTHEKSVGYKSTKNVKRKQQLVTSLNAVQTNMSALLDKYKVLCPPTSVSANANAENDKLLCQQMRDTFNTVVSIQTKLKTLTI